MAKHTILKLLEDMGCACAAYHHRQVRGLHARRIQCDEIWQFVGAKAKNATPEQKAAGWGDAWTWVALDADTKLCISFLIGGRDTGWATDFAFDIRYRVVGRPQIAEAKAPENVATDNYILYVNVQLDVGGQLQYAGGKDFPFTPIHITNDKKIQIPAISVTPAHP